MARFCPHCGKEYGPEIARCPGDGCKTYVVGDGDTLIGRSLEGRFTLTSLVGRGGMGAVYRAH